MARDQYHFGLVACREQKEIFCVETQLCEKIVIIATK